MRVAELLAPFPRFGSPGHLRDVRALFDRVVGPLPAGVKVVGSNGKGSTAAMLSAALEALGYAVGCYTSPHLRAVGERVVIRGVAVPDMALAGAIQAAARGADGLQLSAFDVLTAAAGRLFSAAGLDVVVWEAGLGGRLDATRVPPGDLGVLTSVSLEHTAVLGDTLEAIAVDKAAIVGGRLVHAPVPPGVLAAVRRAHPRLTLVAADEPPAPDLHLRGPHQQANAACALTAARLFSERRWRSAKAQRAVQGCRWPGRFETVRRDPVELIVDVAHNAAGLAAVAATLPDDKPLVLVFGASEGRADAAMVDAIAPKAAHVLYTTPRHKGAPAASLVPFHPGEVVDPLPRALEVAIRRAEALGGRVLVTGGLFLVAEALAVLEGRAMPEMLW